MFTSATNYQVGKGTLSPLFAIANTQKTFSVLRYETSGDRVPFPT